MVEFELNVGLGTTYIQNRNGKTDGFKISRFLESQLELHVQFSPHFVAPNLLLY